MCSVDYLDSKQLIVDWDLEETFLLAGDTHTMREKGKMNDRNKK